MPCVSAEYVSFIFNRISNFNIIKEFLQMRTNKLKKKSEIKNVIEILLHNLIIFNDI